MPRCHCRARRSAWSGGLCVAYPTLLRPRGLQLGGFADRCSTRNTCAEADARALRCRHRQRSRERTGQPTTRVDRSKAILHLSPFFSGRPRLFGAPLVRGSRGRRRAVCACIASCPRRRRHATRSSLSGSHTTADDGDDWSHCRPRGHQRKHAAASGPGALRHSARGPAQQACRGEEGGGGKREREKKAGEKKNHRTTKQETGARRKKSRQRR